MTDAGNNSDYMMIMTHDNNCESDTKVSPHLVGLQWGCSHRRQLWCEELSQVALGHQGALGSWRCCPVDSSGERSSSACPGGGLACVPQGKPSQSSEMGGMCEAKFVEARDKLLSNLC